MYVYLINRYRDGQLEGPILAYETEERAEGWVKGMMEDFAQHVADENIDYVVEAIRVQK